MRRLPLLGLVAALVGCGGDDDGMAGVDAPTGSNADAAAADTDAPAAGPDAGGTDCIDPGGAGTMHGDTVGNDETWSAAGSPHIVPLHLSVNATLTLEPCAAVLIGPERIISVSGAGRIVAQGLERRPITIAPLEPGQPWAAIRASGGGTLRFAWTTIQGGGDPLNLLFPLAAALDLAGDSSLPPQEVLHADHLRVEGSASQGLFLHGGGGFSRESTALVVTGSAGYPIHSWSNLAGTLPDGDYTGNAADEILLTATALNEAIALADVTFRDRGVPYHVGYAGSSGTVLQVAAGAGGLATLTIEPNVTLRFEPNAVMAIERFTAVLPATGAMVAVGTAAQPIRFTSAAEAPAAGDWVGLFFGGIADPSTRLEFVEVEYAGQATAGSSESCGYPGGGFNDAAIRISGGEPASVFITNTTIVESAGHGIDRGFRSDSKPDFLPTNTIDAARCRQTYPRDLSGACPDAVPCP